MERGALTLKNETVAEFPHYLVSRGVPLPLEWGVKDPAEVSLRDADGNEVPSAGEVLQRRPDGSIEWMLCDFVLDFAPEQTHTVYVERRPTELPSVENEVTVEETDDGVTVANGIVTLKLNRSGKIIQSLIMHGKEIIGDDDRADLEVVDPDGKVYRASVSDGYSVTLERCNRLRATALVEGKHAARDGSTFLDFALRFTVSAGRASLQVMHTFYCREPVTGPVRVKGMRLVLPTRMQPDGTKMFHQSQHGRRWRARYVEVQENVEVVASSVSDLNDYAAQYKPYQSGTLFLRNLSSLKEDAGEYPFFISPSGGTEFRAGYMTGGVRQIYPHMGWRQEDFTLVFGMRWWAQHHPKSVSIDENVLTVSLWPEWATLMRIVQGVSKSHTFWLAAQPRALTPKEAEQEMLQREVSRVEPLGVTMDPDWPRFCRVLDCEHYLRYQPAKYAKLEDKIRAIPGEPDRFTYARNAPTGMFNFGDGGGEAGFTNNEDDSRCLIPMLQYLRTGMPHYFDYAQENIEHYMEVDHVEWSTVARSRGGMIPHTADHFIGEVYPSHQWAEGILAYYYVTGDERARKCVIAVADNHVWWVENQLEDVVCDGREAGIPLVNMAAAYRLTRDERYVTATHTIIDNFMKKWFEMWGELKYPYPQGAMLKWTHDYGNYSTYYGLYRMWEVTGDEGIKDIAVKLLAEWCVPERFSADDARMMDFFAVWAYIKLTGDTGIVEKLRDPVDNFVQKGGHPARRLHFLGHLDEIGDERLFLS